MNRTLEKSIFKELQQLKQLVDFIAELPCASERDQRNAQGIKYQIEHIHQPESFKSWNVNIDLFNYHIQSGAGKGVYWRKWSVFFEHETLEIEAKTYHSDSDDHYGDDLYFYYYINFEENYEFERIIKEKGIDVFIHDAMNFEKYRNKNLNELEVELSV